MKQRQRRAVRCSRVPRSRRVKQIVTSRDNLRGQLNSTEDDGLAGARDGEEARNEGRAEALRVMMTTALFIVEFNWFGQEGRKEGTLLRSFSKCWRTCEVYAYLLILIDTMLNYFAELISLYIHWKCLCVENYMAQHKRNKPFPRGCCD